MSRILFLLAICVIAVSCNKAPVQPNIVLIIADDMAWDDSGCYGHPAIRTPNIDRLAAEGMRFTRAFLTCSSCSPSRASLITGRYPHNTGAEQLHWPLPGEQVTVSELLREAGYWTGAAGKWHLGDAVRDRFDDLREVDTSGFQLPAGSTDGKFKETGVGDEKSGCHEWIPMMRARPKEKPFFFWLAALDPHRPYDEGILEEPHRPEDVRVAPYHLDTPEVRHDYTLYYDEITRLDRYVGLVMEELEAQGAAENTFVLFISDNGRPFPRDKTSVYDSGIRTPWIVKGPGVEAGSLFENIVSSVDIAPTFLDMAGAGIPMTMEGMSFLRIFGDPGASIRDYAFAEKNWHDYEDHSRAVRGRRYKYIRNYFNDLPGTPPADAVRGDTFQTMLKLEAEGKLTDAQRMFIVAPRPAEELFDTDADPHEIVNLVDDPAHAEALEDLRGALKLWEEDTEDRVPKLRTADEFDRLTGNPTPARVRPRWSKKRMVEAGLTAP